MSVAPSSGAALTRSFVYWGSLSTWRGERDNRPIQQSHPAMGCVGERRADPPPDDLQGSLDSIRVVMHVRSSVRQDVAILDIAIVMSLSK